MQRTCFKAGILAVTLLLAACSGNPARHSAHPTVFDEIRQAPESAQAQYETLRDRAMEGGDVDFHRLRAAYALSGDYAPAQGSHVTEAIDELEGMLFRNDFEGCYELVEPVESRAFPLLSFQHFAGVCAEEAGRVPDSVRHKLLAQSLFSAILESGDGKSLDSGYFVLSMSEMAIVLEALPVNPESVRRLQTREPTEPDVAIVTVREEQEDRTLGQPVEMYFDITMLLKASR